MQEFAGQSADAPDVVDVVIVGAGLAGLSAARELSRAGATVRVLEARDRVGGRVLSRRLGSGPVVELGAQWIGPGQDHMAALVKELGLSPFPQHCTGDKVLLIGDKLSTYKNDIPSLPLLGLLDLDRTIKKIEAMCQQVPLAAPETAPKAREWDATTVETWKRDNVLTAGARTLLDVAVQSIFSAEPAEVSLLHCLWVLHSGGGLMKLSTIPGGAQQTRLIEGFQTVAERLAAELAGQLRLSAPVRAVVQDDHGVLVHSRRGTVRGRRVIIAVPPALAGRIDYEPALPVARDQLTQRMPMGSVCKCVAVYERPFWRDRGLSGEAIGDRGPVRLVFDDSPATDEGTGHGTLVAFVLADGLRDLRELDVGARRKAVIAGLVRLFGPKASEPLDFIEQDWGTERWSRGCYFGLMPTGTLSRYGAALRTPCGAIHFAGTETAEHGMGYMEGAVESGLRAAREVLPLIGRSPKG